MTGLTVPSIGVEEEYQLVDPCTRGPAPLAAQVIALAEPRLGERVKPELFPTQVEVCTAPVTSLGALRAELAELRAEISAAARAVGCRFIAAGTAVLDGGTPLNVTDQPRYRRVGAHVGSALVQALSCGVCGCHVHLGTLTRAEALAVSNHLRPWLPALQALAANSPYCHGTDTGFASWRFLRWGQWPTVGPAPLLDEAGYERLADTLVGSGVLLDRKMIYWYARPNEHVPTVEIRVADVNADLDTTVLLAGLLRGLGAVLLAEARDGAPPPAVPESVLRAAHWRAAAGGLDGPGVDPFTGRPAPLRHLVERLAERAEPGLAAAGDLPLVGQLLDQVIHLGTGAARQRAVHRRHHRLSDVVDHLVEYSAAPVLITP